MNAEEQFEMGPRQMHGGVDDRSNLLLCPWCNGHTIEIMDAPHNQFAMTCEDCGATGPAAEYEDHAKFLWNNRYRESQLEKAISELGGAKYFEEWEKVERFAAPIEIVQHHTSGT